MSALEEYDTQVYVIYGLRRLYEQLTDDGKEKLSVLLEKAEAIYKLHFVIVENLTEFNGFQYDAWFKRHVSGADGLWIGDGIADQYLLKVNKVTTELYEEVGEEYGYLLTKNKPVLVKLLSSNTEEVM